MIMNLIPGAIYRMDNPGNAYDTTRFKFLRWRDDCKPPYKDEDFPVMQSLDFTDKDGLPEITDGFFAYRFKLIQSPDGIHFESLL